MEKPPVGKRTLRLRQSHKLYRTDLLAIVAEAASLGTIEEVAARTGISARQIYELRKGKIMPRLVSFMLLIKGNPGLVERSFAAADRNSERVKQVYAPERSSQTGGKNG